MLEIGVGSGSSSLEPDLAMSNFGNFVQKAVYFGIGLASYATEKAGGTLAELRQQAQKLAEELVEKGEMTADEAKRIVDEMVRQAQSRQASVNETPQAGPRRIDISEDAADPTEQMRQKIQQMREELNRLKNQ